MIIIIIIIIIIIMVTLYNKVSFVSISYLH